jgi:hypothetical protein
VCVVLLNVIITNVILLSVTAPKKLRAKYSKELESEKVGNAAYIFFFFSNSFSFSILQPGNTKGGSITVPLTSCLTGLESAV